jgi:hypothetical protein
MQVSSEDAIEGMAYYIALYLARAPEARHMEPKQLQEALRSTFTVRHGCRRRCLQDSRVHAAALFAEPQQW